MKYALFIVMLLTAAAVVPMPASAATTSASGGGQPHDNMQPFVVLQPVINPANFTFQSGDVRVRLNAGTPNLIAPTNGQLLPIASNQLLFSLMGTTYGGDGQTTFALPDLRGRIPVHAGSLSQIGDIGGTETVTLNTSQMPIHLHTTPLTLTPPLTPGAATGIAGGNQAHTNLQPSLDLRYMVAVNGIFPGSSVVGHSVTNPFLGEVALTAGLGNAPPNNWLFAEGQLLPISQNPALFSLLGTTYGGNGQTNFALPDLRDRTVIGAGDGPGLTDRPLGQTLGTSSVTLDANELPSHNHGISPMDGGGVTGNTGGGLPHNNMGPSAALNYIIALEGVFPLSGDPAPDQTFLGEVKMFAGNFAPQGYALAEGQLLPIAQHSALFSLLGTTYGGNGQTNFALPDLRGRAVVGAGDGFGLTNRQLGDNGGSETNTLTVLTMPTHAHNLLDLDAPNAVSANATEDGLMVIFKADEVLAELSAADPFNYFVLDDMSNSLTINAAQLLPDGMTVKLTLDAPLVGPGTLQFSSLEDLAGNSADGDIAIAPFVASGIPEPATATLAVLGLTGLLARRRRHAA